MQYGKLLFCETVYSRGTCKEITLGTNFPLGNKSAARYLPKDTDRGLGALSTDIEIRELISAVKQPEVDSSAPSLTDKVRVSPWTEVTYPIHI